MPGKEWMLLRARAHVQYSASPYGPGCRAAHRARGAVSPLRASIPDASAPGGAARCACPPGRPGRPSARRRRLACPELRWVKSALSHAKVKAGRGNPRLRRRCAPCTVPPRTYRPSLRQDRTAAGYAVKALLARSVLAFGCAPHAASGASMTAPAAVRPCLRGDRYTVSLRGGPVLRWSLTDRASRQHRQGLFRPRHPTRGLQVPVSGRKTQARAAR